MISNQHDAFLLQAAVLNNQAVAMLAAGHTDSAIAGFSRGLALLQQNVAYDDDLDQPASIVEGRSVIPIQIPNLSDCDSLYIHDRAFIIDASVFSNANARPGEPCLALTAMLMFNLSLAYHHGANVSPNGSENKCQQAIRIYCICIELLVGGVHGPLGVALHTAATNNLAYLLLRVFDAKGAAAELLLEIGRAHV